MHVSMLGCVCGCGKEEGGKVERVEERRVAVRHRDGG